MLWRLTLAVAAVCVGGMCGCAKAELMSRLIMPRDYGVKLCGREFIRAVIFTCGGSRWRRSTDGDADPLQRTSLSFVTAANNQHIWRRSVQLTDRLLPPHDAPVHSLPELLALFEADRQQQQQQQQQQPSYPDVMEDSQPSAEQQEEDPGTSSLSALSKKKRNFSLGVAGMCCTQGCTKNDIGRLC